MDKTTAVIDSPEALGAALCRHVPDMANGFTITTQACVETMNRKGEWPEGLDEQAWAGLQRLEERTGRKLGDPDKPLLVSVRSGAIISMPGMMDTILNLGISDETVPAIARESGNERFAWDCYRRFIQMYGEVVEGIDAHVYEDALTALKESKGVESDTDLSADDLKGLVGTFKKLSNEQLGGNWTTDPREQLMRAVDAVFRSWLNPRAFVYRKANKISDDLGTAVNVMQMVFGNRGDDSATGVCFTRNPATGANELYGEFLQNAQGEDVVAGIRTPQYLTRAAREAAGAKPASMEEAMPGVYAQLADVFDQIAAGALTGSKAAGTLTVGVDTLPPFKADAGDPASPSALTLVGHTATVIGAGPAGLEAARRLAERGSRVTLLESDDRLGGALTGWTSAPMAC